jgi:hypothetical protein
MTWESPKRPCIKPPVLSRLSSPSLNAARMLGAVSTMQSAQHASPPSLSLLRAFICRVVRGRPGHPQPAFAATMRSPLSHPVTASSLVVP